MNDSILYHYCNNTALESIIKGRQLWMTDISNSNDYNEVQLFNPNIFYAIIEIYQNDPFFISYKGMKNLDALNDLLVFISNIINRLYDNGHLTSFVSCLCEDGDVLSQWRGYADDGKGCSIGFSKEELLHFCNNTEGMIQFKKVIYVNEWQLNEIIKKEATHICETNRKVKYYNEAMLLIDLRNLIEETILNSLIYKMEGFREELEWRLFFGKSIKSASLSDGKICEEHVNMDYLEKTDFITKDDIMTLYYPLDLFNLSNKPIKKIFFGPKNRVRMTDIKIILEKNGMSGVELARSRVSYC